MLDPTVLYEDNHLLIVSKPAGWLVQGDRTGDQTLADWGKDYLKKKYDKPGAVFLGVVHRLDRPVSGVVAMARTSKALARMNQLFKTRRVTKTYWALVQTPPPQPEATLIHWLIKDSAKNKVTAFHSEKKDSKQAELLYRLLVNKNSPSPRSTAALLPNGERIYLLEVKPITGRSHQIRVQLAAMGCPIVGDVKYGFAAPNADASIGLHARQLSFVHPVKREPMSFRADVPSLDLWQPFASVEETKQG